MRLQAGRQQVLLEDLHQRLAVSDRLQRLRIYLPQSGVEAGERVRADVLGQGGMSMDEQPRRESLDQRQGVEETFRRALRQEGRAKLRHEDVPDEENTGRGQVNQQ